jgi:hypothetical protein
MKQGFKGLQMNVCALKTGMEISSAVFAIAAALWWFAAAWVGFTRLSLDNIEHLQWKQALFNAIAASLAGAAAIFQFASTCDEGSPFLWPPKNPIGYSEP